VGGKRQEKNDDRLLGNRRQGHLYRQTKFAVDQYHLEEPITLKAPHQAPLRLRNRRMATELLPAGMRVPLEETDAPAPKLMRQLKDLFPELSEQSILERALERLLVDGTRKES
jgi:hypothetical protein